MGTRSTRPSGHCSANSNRPEYDAVSARALLSAPLPHEMSLNVFALLTAKSYVHMWRIEEHCRVDKQIVSMPREILKRYEKWKDIAAISGPPGLRLIKGFHDEALSGEWQGYHPLGSACNGG